MAVIRNLDALRAVAAWMVVAHHLREHLAWFWGPLAETHIFAAGVDIFFIISGVVMVVSSHDRNMRPGEFWARRAARIAPLYWLVTVAIALALLAGLRPLGIGDCSMQDLGASLLFWPDIRSDGYPAPLLPVGWTLIYEAGFYGLFGLCLFAGRRAPVVALASLISIAALGTVLEGQSHAVAVWTAPLILEFAMGVALGLWWVFPRGWLGAPVVLSAMAILFVGGAYAAVWAPDGEMIAPGSEGAEWRCVMFGVPAAALILVALAAERQGRVARWRWLQRQGAASYAIYLIHLPIIQIVEKGAGGAVIWLAPPLVALGALWVHTAIEAPANRFWLASLQQRPKSSSRRMMSSSSR